jgi:hypothetical protein
MFGVGLDGSRRIQPAHIGWGPFGQMALDGFGRIVWMIIGMIKALPIERRMLSVVGSR